MTPDLDQYFRAIWTALLVIWLIGAVTTKRTARREMRSSRLIEVAACWLAYVLLSGTRPGLGVLNERFVPEAVAVSWTGVALTMAGVLFAVWARFYLGGNWSSAVTVKEGHTLIRGGPYAVVRHPIYSGLSLAVLGTATAVGEFRGLVAVGLVVLAWRHKSLVEERFMREEFGAEYERYCRDVKALIPFVW
jgi:protein-S-isoprenylcysteine O-methyltransferase